MGLFAGSIVALLLVAAAVSLWMSTRPRQPQEVPVAPHTVLDTKDPDRERFVNTRAALGAGVRPHFVPFSFEMPRWWHVESAVALSATSYACVYYKGGRVQPSERLDIGWYRPNGEEPLAAVARRQVDRFAFPLPYSVLGEGPRRVADRDGYELVIETRSQYVVPFRFARLIVLPTGHPDGLALLVQARWPVGWERQRAEDVGVKGDLAGVLASFHIDPPVTASGR
jgi:hypothetical protein